MNILKGIGAIIAGTVTAIVLTTIADAVLESLGIFAPVGRPGEYSSWMLFIALAYRIGFTALGGFVVGKLAPEKPVGHILVMAIIATLLGIGGILASWGVLAAWFLFGQAILSFPAVWYGGKVALGKS